MSSKIKDTSTLFYVEKASAMIVTLMTIAMFMITGSYAYDDLRNKHCRSKHLDLDNLDDKDVIWMKNIVLKLNCEPGYDYPLNFSPETSELLTCKPDNKWYPDFLPDCNKEIIPNPKCPKGTAKVTKKVKKTNVKVCRGCPLGFFLKEKSANHFECAPCPYGQYQDKPLQASCKPCPGLEPEDLKDIKDIKNVMSRVTKHSKNRLYHNLGCAIIQRSSNGSLLIMESDFDDEEEDENEKKRKLNPDFQAASGGTRKERIGDVYLIAVYSSLLITLRIILDI